jgi:hypothetical protein
MIVAGTVIVVVVGDDIGAAVGCVVCGSEETKFPSINGDFVGASGNVGAIVGVDSTGADVGIDVTIVKFSNEGADTTTLANASVAPACDNNVVRKVPALI